MRLCYVVMTVYKSGSNEFLGSIEGNIYYYLAETIAYALFGTFCDLKIVGWVYYDTGEITCWQFTEPGILKYLQDIFK